MKNLVITAAAVLLFFFFVPVRTLICKSVVGCPEMAGFRHNGKPAELPFAILLDSVSVSYHPYRLYIVNTSSKKALPKKNPAHLDIPAKKGDLLDWNVSVDTFMVSASPEGNCDSVYYSHFDFTGGAPACGLTAVSRLTGDTVSGWACSGSPLFRPQSLYLTADTSIVFPQRMVSDISSVIRIFRGDSFSEAEYISGHGKILFKYGCYIKQTLPAIYTDIDVGSSDYKIFLTLFGTMLSLNVEK